MNIKGLRAFRTTLAEGSLAAASHKLHLSQPALSRLISTLEAELHLTLFDRSGRNLKPTKEGLAFYREAGRILDNLDEIPAIAAQIRAGRSMTLRIVTMPRVAQSLAAPALAQLIAQEPDINVSLDVRARREASKWLAGREYDIGIGALPVDHPEIETELLLRVQAKAVVPVDHPLASFKEISAEDMASYPIVRLMHGLLLRDQLDDFFQSAGVPIQQSCEVASSQLACSLVAEGGGITIADELLASQMPLGKVIAIPVVPERWMSFGLLFPKNSEASNAREIYVSNMRDLAHQLARQSDSIISFD